MIKAMLMLMRMSWHINGLVIWLRQPLANIIGCKKVLQPITPCWQSAIFLVIIITIFKLYESAVDLGRQDLAGEGTSLLNAKSSSLTFYQRGAWVLHALRGLVGDDVFKKAVKAYLEKHQFKNVETSDFIKEVERFYGKSLNMFVNVWIKRKDFPVDAAFGLLQNESTFINEYLMVDLSGKNI